MVREYEKRRDYICGCIHVGGTGLKARKYSNRLLDAYHVAVVPGDNFEADDADCVRLSYTTSMEQIMEVCNRMEQLSNALFNEQSRCAFA